MTAANPVPGEDPLPPPDIFEADPVDVRVEWDLLTGSTDPEPAAIGEAFAALGPADGDRTGRPWTIPDDDAAEWAMVKLRAAGIDISQKADQRDAYIDRVARWFDAVTRTARQTYVHMDALLEEYGLRRRRETRAAVKTVKLPSGNVGTRSGGAARVDIEDEAAVISWADLHAPEIVERKPRVTVTALRTVARVVDGKPVGPDGMPIPGATVTVPGDTATVSPHLI